MSKKLFATAAPLVLFAAACFAPGCAPDSGLDDEDWEDSAEADGALRVCAEGATVEGIDVSYYQGKINWSKVAGTSVKFAFIRASYGSEFEDPRFQENWAGAKSAGIVRGAYQYFRPSQDPKEQAQVMIDLLADDPIGVGDLPAVLDVEQTDGLSSTKLRQRVQVWLDTVEAGTGKRPIVYTAAFMQDAVGSGFDDYALWAANYTSKCPLMPSGWDGWQFWQYSDKGTVAGITGAVDKDRFNGSYQDLLAFAAGSGNASPGTDPGTDPGTTPDTDPGTTPDPAPAGDPAGAPTGLTPDDGDAIQTDSVTMSCAAFSGATSYAFQIEYYDEGSSSWNDYYAYTSTTQQKTFWPVLDAAFRFRVRAKSGGVWSPYSNYRSFTFGDATLP
jgi:lysozyme